MMIFEYCAIFLFLQDNSDALSMREYVQCVFNQSLTVELPQVIWFPILLLVAACDVIAAYCKFNGRWRLDCFVNKHSTDCVGVHDPLFYHVKKDVLDFEQYAQSK